MKQVFLNLFTLKNMFIALILKNTKCCFLFYKENAKHNIRILPIFSTQISLVVSSQPNFRSTKLFFDITELKLFSCNCYVVAGMNFEFLVGNTMKFVWK